MMRRLFQILLSSVLLSQACLSQGNPVRVGVAGLTHTHVHWILGREKRGDIEIVGIAEPNRELAERYARQHGFSMSIVHDSLEDMVAAAKPQAITAFGTIYEHLHVVEVAAPRGIHVMVEKPLAVSVDHARKMAALARRHNIHLLTNYETTWYPTNHKTLELLKSNAIGELTQVIVRDGHRGPKRIGINEEFLDWLVDPVQNGGGALIDFGCYGANLSTWLHDGRKPTSVTAVTQQFQPENNPRVDDEATIILTYPRSKTTIQASWNWPTGRKDMEVYGTTGAIYADNRVDLRVRIAEGYDGFKEETLKLPERSAPYHDPFSLLAAVVNSEIRIAPSDLSSLENNLIVVEILEAARQSARTGKTVRLSQ